MQDYINQILNAVTLVSENMPHALLFVGVLWVILLINKLLSYRLNYLGIYPRHPFGLVGIFLHPFLHGSFNHLFFNSIPLFVLLTFMLTVGFPSFLCASILIILLSGVATWLFGRRAIHVGASGLIMGYWGYLLILAYRNPTILSFILAIICVYYFGSLLLSIFPSEERTSWEGHLFGLLAGIVTAYLCPYFAI